MALGPRGGEIVVFDDSDAGICLIKWVLAVGCDIVQRQDEHVFINSKKKLRSCGLCKPHKRGVWKPSALVSMKSAEREIREVAS